jgi:hypothetical protein
MELIAPDRHPHEILARQYDISRLRCSQPVLEFSNFKQIQLLGEDNPNHALALLEYTIGLRTRKRDKGLDDLVAEFNLKDAFP